MRYCAKFGARSTKRELRSYHASLAGDKTGWPCWPFLWGDHNNNKQQQSRLHQQPPCRHRAKVGSLIKYLWRSHHSDQMTSGPSGRPSPPRAADRPVGRPLGPLGGPSTPRAAFFPPRAAFFPPRAAFSSFFPPRAASCPSRANLAHLGRCLPYLMVWFFGLLVFIGFWFFGKWFIGF